VVRLSGPAARAVAEAILRASGAWEPWRVRTGELLDEDGRVVDQVVATFFAAPRSYTAEDVVEISCHGAPVVLRHAVSSAVQAGARIAEPGEFTLRAYVNGRIDLPQAEAVRDLIDATTLYQARVAAQQVGGSVSRRIAPLKEQLLELIALLEAGIDFAEDDVSVAPDVEILRRLEPVRTGIERLAASFAYGGLVRSGITLAIVGRPNVGKSSLFNRLLEQDRAIVTDIPGTTRDLVSETASIGGIPVKLVDTAGIREGTELVESLGIERSWQAMASGCGEQGGSPGCALGCLGADGAGNRGAADGDSGGGRAGRGVRAGDGFHHEPPARAAPARVRDVPGEGGGGGRGEDPSRNAAAGFVRGAAADRRDHRRDHGGRHPESDLLDVLHREVAPTTRHR
jgi:hypothetical protein